MTVLKMEDKVQYKRHILTSGTITVESLHPMHIQLSAFFHSFLSHLHTYTYFKVALRQQNEHYIWHYEAFLVELPKALSVEKKSITREVHLSPASPVAQSGVSIRQLSVTVYFVRRN